MTVLAREWTGDPADVVRCDPFHIGRVWRDWSFARAVCREARPAGRSTSCNRTSASPAATSTAPATACTRNGWTTAAPRSARSSRAGHRAQPLSPLRSRRGAAPVLRARGLRAVICNSRMVKQEIRSRFGRAEAKLPRHLQRRRPRAPSTRGCATRTARQPGPELGIPAGRPDLRVCRQRVRAQRRVSSPARAFARPARGCAAHLIVVGEDQGASRARRLCARDLGVGGRTHSFSGLRRTCVPGTALPTLSCCRRSTIRFRTRRWKRWLAACRSSSPSQCGAAELVSEGENGLVCDARRRGRARRLAAAARRRPRAPHGSARRETSPSASASTRWRTS